MKNTAKEKNLKNRILNTVKKWLMVILNPKLLLCLLCAWMITNGWSYVFAFLGSVFDITWMTVAGTAYMSLLWVPFTPEKLLTVAIAIFLMRLIFPRDKKTIGVLKEEFRKLKESYVSARDRRRERRMQRRMKRQKEKA